MSLDKVVKAINKQFGDGALVKASEMKSLEIQRVSTGSFTMDVQLGGGWAVGRVCVVYGPESSGKTTMALKGAAEFQKEGFPVVWIDAEGSWDESWSEAMGIDLDDIRVGRPDGGESAWDIAEAVIRSSDEGGLLVIDSLATLVPTAEIENSMSDQQMAEAARMNNKGFRKISAAMNSRGDADPWTVLIINQTREAVGVMYGDPTVLPGGKGQKYHSSITIAFRTGEWIKAPRDMPEYNIEKGEMIGHQIKFNAKKNKTYAPHKKGAFDFYVAGPMKGQIDRMKEVVDFAIFHGIIERRGAWYYIDGVEESFQGKNNLNEFLRDHPEHMRNIERAVMRTVQGANMPDNEEQEEDSE